MTSDGASREHTSSIFKLRWLLRIHLAITSNRVREWSRKNSIVRCDENQTKTSNCVSIPVIFVAKCVNVRVSPVILLVAQIKSVHDEVS